MVLIFIKGFEWKVIIIMTQENLILIMNSSTKSIMGSFKRINAFFNVIADFINSNY